jgi:Phage tail protein (Tail_P2_I)
VATLQPPASINDARAQALMVLIERLGALDLTPLLVYRIDSVPAGALPFLAWQFDILSPLWQLIAPTSPSVEASATEAARDLVKLAIALHRVRGTPYAVKTALAALGWPGAGILEGQASWGGSSWPASQGWAACRISVPLAATQFDANAIPPWDPSVSYAPGNIVTWLGGYFVATGAPLVGVAPEFASVDEITDLTVVADWDALVTAGWTSLGVSPPPYRPPAASDVSVIGAVFDFFKPSRCWLDSVWFVYPAMSDTLGPAPSDVKGIFDYLGAVLDRFTAILAAASDSYAFVPTYGDHRQHAGFSYAADPIGPSDGATTLNGVPVEGNK